MIIINSRLRDKQGFYDIFIKNGKFDKIIPKNILNEVDTSKCHPVQNLYVVYKSEDLNYSNIMKYILSLADSKKIDMTEYNSCDVIDARGMMLIPPFIEPHIHLDTTMSAGEPRWNKSGTLFEGIQCWSERKEFISIEDVKKRARQAMLWHIAGGVQYVRSHVDVTDQNLTALKALVELKDELKDYINLQLVAFPQEGILSFPNGKSLMSEALEIGADVIGAIPHFEFTREYGVESINYIFKLMEKYDKLVDVHCDEIDDEQSRFVEVLATRAYEMGVGSKVTASHTTAMHSYNNAYAYKIFRLFKMSGINFVANPLVNIHLQGRFDTYPKRRGITRVKELLEAGINVCFGHDDVFDPWYPLGTADMVEVLHMGVHICQMMGYDELNKALDLITYNSARTLDIVDKYGIEEKKPANMLLINAENSYDIIRRHKKPVLSIKNGNIISSMIEASNKVYMENNILDVTFEK